MADLNGWLSNCSPDNAKPPSLVRREGTTVVGEADSRIKCYYLMQRERLVLYDRLIAAKALGIHQQLAYARYRIAYQIFETEVWSQYHELVGKLVEVYSDWSIGPKKIEAATGDLFKPVGLKEIVAKIGSPVSTRSADVKLGALRATV